jgi:6-phosphogluconate dehydrogenase
LRRVVALAAAAGQPAPALAASLSWLETLRTGRGSAGLIQAQLDYLGSHGYERKDAPGRKQNTDWKQSAEKLTD